MDDQTGVFLDRRDAGRQLAAHLLDYRSENPVVLALPRGGVPVAFEIASALNAPLDLVLVRKIGVPFQPELAMGAIVDGKDPEIVVNSELVAELAISDACIKKEAKRQLVELERRRATYLAGREPVPIADATTIVVDDGIATGATAEVALRSVRRRKPRRIVLATPVAPPEALDRLKPYADAIVCLATPTSFGAIGMFYQDFTQISDEEVIALLLRSPPVKEALRRSEHPARG
jgi:putative phosphoribosyl transferase